MNLTSAPTEQSVLPDGELLRRYLDSRDDIALTELITRHAAVVRGVCRRVLGNSSDADDAFQATFLVLVRSGGRIYRPQSLAAWLFGVAHRIAKRQRRHRGLPTQTVRDDHVMIEHDPLAELATRHDISLFDAELARLPEKYRSPIVLHHLEGKSQREVAAELHLTEGAVDGLLKRGRNELRLRLARQGVTFGVILAAVQTTQDAVAALPPQTLIETTVQGMLLHDPILHPEPLNTPVARLAHQEISTMTLFQITKVTAWTLVGSLFLGAAGVGVSTARNNPLGNQAGVIASELAVAQVTTELPAEVSGQPTESPPNNGNGIRIKDLPDGTQLGIPGFVFPDGTGVSITDKTAAQSELSDFVSLGEFQPNKVGGFGGILESPGITVTPVEITPQRTKIVVSGAFELNDETAKSLRATLVLKDGKEVSPDVWRNVVAGKGNQVVTLLLDSPIPAKEIAKVKLHRMPNKPEASGVNISSNQAHGNAGTKIEVSGFAKSTVAKPLLSVRKSSTAEARIFSKLNEATEVSFIETTLRDALEYVEDLHNFDILVLESEITADGGSIDQQINLELSNVTLESMLNRLLEPLELDYVIDDEIMLITTKTKAEERLETRVYPLKLLTEAWGTMKTDDDSDAGKLMKSIQQVVAGEWEADGGVGTMTFTPAGLVIRQNQRTHREVENFFEQLRRAREVK